ncbi:MAG: YggS family pyridoxal phosphate-dependent enzyme [Bacteroidota bacterium]|nr:YggS family pyridoxal phosphate-dependent enzyme [Bacteroidota bacterium]
MAISKEDFQTLIEKLTAQNVTLVAVSKIQPLQKILQLYELGQRDFGENYVQELVEKQSKLPKDIKWHFIGHLQSNKVKYIAPFVHLIHGVDSLKLLKEINKQGKSNNRSINVLLQIHIATEATKFGLDNSELDTIINQISESPLTHVKIMGLMGMATYIDDVELINKEFKSLKQLFDLYKNSNVENLHFEILSMGMSADYKLAIEGGSNMIRIGTLLFGARGMKDLL